MTYYYEHLPSEPEPEVVMPQTRPPFGAPKQRKMKPILGYITGRRVKDD